MNFNTWPSIKRLTKNIAYAQKRSVIWYSYPSNTSSNLQHEGYNNTTELLCINLLDNLPSPQTMTRLSIFLQQRTTETLILGWRTPERNIDWLGYFYFRFIMRCCYSANSYTYRYFLQQGGVESFVYRIGCTVSERYIVFGGAATMLLCQP